jgi:hypothetical protein
MKLAVLLVALSALLCVGVGALLLGPLASGELARGAALGVYVVALLLAVTASILSDLTALRQQRLARFVALALLTLLGLVSASVTAPIIVALIDAVTRSPVPDLAPPPVPGTAFIAWAFAPSVVLPLTALGALPPARPRYSARAGGSSGVDAAAPTPLTPVVRQPMLWPALVSVVVALYTPVAVLLALLIYQLRHAVVPLESPVIRLLGVLIFGLLVLIIPAVGVAIVSGHVALSRLRHQPAPKFWRTVAWWGLVLGYGTFPVLLALYVWAMLTSGGE